MPNPAVTNSKGVILQVGIVVNNDRTELVIPCATDGALSDNNTRCFDAVTGFEANVLPALLAAMSSGAYVSFLQADGMVNGMIPFRTNYAAGVKPGTRGAAPVPSSTGGLISFYAEPADLGVGARMRTAHNTIPGPDVTDLSGDALVGAYKGVLNSFGLSLQVGFLGGGPGDTFYRVLAAKHGAGGQPLIRVAFVDVPGYVATYRRRILPHP